MNCLDYNVTGEQRKKLVRAISEILGEDSVYQGAPSFAYSVDGYTISRNGQVTCPDTATREDISQLIAALREQGFELENTADDPDRLVVEMPRAGFSAAALDNLQKIIASKAELFKKAIGTDTLEVETTAEKLRFPWFTLHGLEGEADAYTKLITGICDMAKRQKRVVARERAITNEKFTMRVFLIRLGFIGPEYQTARTLLLRNLTGNSSWLSGPPPAQQRRRRDRKTPPLMLPAIINGKGAVDEWVLDGVARWLETFGTVLSDEQRSNEYTGVRIVTVRFRDKKYQIIQVDGATCKIETV